MAQTRVGNLVLAGDWTDTGLPATIESAVVSGRRAAEVAANIAVSPNIIAAATRSGGDKSNSVGEPRI